MQHFAVENYTTTRFHAPNHLFNLIDSKSKSNGNEIKPAQNHSRESGGEMQLEIEAEAAKT